MKKVIIGDSPLTNKVEATSLVTQSYQLDSHISLLPVTGNSVITLNITGSSLIDIKGQ